MAIDLSAVRSVLTMEWWENNRAGLVAVASKDQWSALTAAAQAGYYLLMSLSEIGDVGQEVWRKRAEALAGQGSDSQQELDKGTESSPSGYSDPQMAEMDAEVQRITTEFETELAKLWTELRGTEALLDIRLWQVRDVHNTFLSAGPKFDAAERACRSLEDATQGHLGLLGSMSR